MIRQKDLHRFLDVIGAALAGPIMSDLQSDPAKAVARGVLEMIDRIAADIVDGDAMAASVDARVAALEQGLASFGIALPAVDGAGPVREQVDARLMRLQAALETDGGAATLEQRLARGDAQAVTWMRTASDLLRAQNLQLEASFAARGTRPAIHLARHAPDDLRQRLSDYLAHRYPALAPDPVVAFSVVPGGNSKLTALFSIVPNAVLPEHLALRVDIANSITGAQLKDEYPILRRVFALGLPVPEPLLFETNPEVLGGAFLISAQVRDATFGASSFAEDRARDGTNPPRSVGVDLACLLARLHAGTHEPGVRPDLARERDETVECLCAEWRTMDKPPLSLCLDLGVSWMRANPLPAGRPTSIIHGDPGLHNILVRDGRVVAFLDWELSRPGDPAEDMAEMKTMMIDGVITWDDFVAAYLDAGGLRGACDPHAVAWYQIQSFLKHGVNLTRLRNVFLRGERNDLSAALVASHYQDRITGSQIRALHDALQLAREGLSC